MYNPCYASDRTNRVNQRQIWQQHRGTQAVVDDSPADGLASRRHLFGNFPMAFFVASMRGGGAERVTLNLIGELAGRGHAVDLVLAQGEGPYLANVPESVRVVDLQASRVLSSGAALIRYLRRERPTVLLSAMHYVNVVALWARRLARVPTQIVVTEHNTLSHNARHASNRRGRLMPHMIKRFYPWADGIVAVSKGVADDLARVTGISRHSIRVIYNPVVTPGMLQDAKAPASHPWFEYGQPPVLLAVGRLKAQKDFPTLIKAFARIRQTRPVRLIILGEGPERAALETLIRDLHLQSEVQLPGFVDNPYAFMSRSALFVLSSRWEGLPTVLIEALACDTPVIATDCPSGPREILADGQYGRLVPVGDVAALARAIETSLAGGGPRPSSDSWRPFGLAGVVDQYLEVLVRG